MRVSGTPPSMSDRRRQPVYDLAHVGLAHPAIQSRFGRSTTREHLVPVRPFRTDCSGSGRSADMQDLCRAAEPGQAIVTMLAIIRSRSGARQVSRGGRVHVSLEPSESRQSHRRDQLPSAPPRAGQFTVILPKLALLSVRKLGRTQVDGGRKNPWKVRRAGALDPDRELNPGVETNN